MKFAQTKDKKVERRTTIEEILINKRFDKF